MGTTWGTAGRAAPTVSTEWLSATLETPQNCPFPPPSSSQDPPSPTQGHSALLRTHTHCLFSPSIAQNPLSPAQDAPSTAYSPSAHLRTPRATKHCSGPPRIAHSPPPQLRMPQAPLRTTQNCSGPPKHCPFPTSTAQTHPPNCPVSPSTSQDSPSIAHSPPPALCLLPFHLSGAALCPEKAHRPPRPRVGLRQVGLRGSAGC